MSEHSPLHLEIRKRFVAVFGQPNSALDRDDHWALHPKAALAPPINVLVNGSAQVPAVWVFDPHQPHDGAVGVAITNEDLIGDTIEQILNRVEQANKKHHQR